MSWSSGKDSAWALHELRRAQDVEVVGLLTTITAEIDRVSMHGVRRSLVSMQAASIGLPLHVVEIPDPCPNAIYEARMGEVLDRARAEQVDAIAFGDLFLQDIRAYRERMLQGTGIEPLFPLWGRPTDALARAMIDGGLKAIVTCIDPQRVDASLCGRPFDHPLLDSLPSAVDPCAEHGEFHTLVWDGPMFAHPLRVSVGSITEQRGYVFADVRPLPGDSPGRHRSTGSAQSV